MRPSIAFALLRILAAVEVESLPRFIMGLAGGILALDIVGLSDGIFGSGILNFIGAFIATTFLSL
jgi:uncharacterized membrane protein YeaQ/YmgE (transglycosylase-associated protein family)